MIMQIMQAPPGLELAFKEGFREPLRLLALVQTSGGKTAVEPLELTEEGFRLAVDNPDFLLIRELILKEDTDL